MIFLLATVGVRFLIFSHVHMAWLRRMLCRGPVAFLCRCSFCQGFHCGFVLSILFEPWWHAVVFAFAAAICSYLLASVGELLDRILSRYEEEQ